MVDHPVLLFLIGLGLSAVLTPMVRWAALRYGWVAHPSSDRWHKKPTALMGGIAIFGALAIGLVLVADFGSVVGHVLQSAGPKQAPSVAVALLVGASFLFGVVDFLGKIEGKDHVVVDAKTVSTYNDLVSEITGGDVTGNKSPEALEAYCRKRRSASRAGLSGRAGSSGSRSAATGRKTGLAG